MMETLPAMMDKVLSFYSQILFQFPLYNQLALRKNAWKNSDILYPGHYGGNAASLLVSKRSWPGESTVSPVMLCEDWSIITNINMGQYLKNSWEKAHNIMSIQFL